MRQRENTAITLTVNVKVNTDIGRMASTDFFPEEGYKAPSRCAFPLSITSLVTCEIEGWRGK